MENINSWLTIPNDLSLTIKLKNFYSISTQNIPVSGTKCQVSRSVWGTGHSLIQQSQEITGICSTLFESRGNFSSEMRIKCIRKSLSFDSGKESSFQLCYSPFFGNEKGILLEKKFDPRLFLGLLLGSRRSAIGQTFFSVPSNNPRSLCESYWPIFPLLFLITIPEVFAKVNSTQFPTRF